jgi:hypothetical protein
MEALNVVVIMDIIWIIVRFVNMIVSLIFDHLPLKLNFILFPFFKGIKFQKPVIIFTTGNDMIVFEENRVVFKKSFNGLIRSIDYSNKTICYVSVKYH